MIQSTRRMALLACLGVASATSVASAGDVKMFSTWDNKDAVGVGGPFSAQHWDHGSGSPIGDPWITFCVEGNETFSGGSQYWKEISTDAVFGGYGPGNPDPLSSGSAWLYRQVYDAVHKGASNALTSVSWNSGASTFDIGDINDLSEIQRVIWSFEGESDAGGAINSDRFNAIVGLVSATLGADYTETNDGLFGVRVMQLWKHPTERDWDDRAQDQLIVIPLPQTAGLAAAGLLGLGIRRRR